MIEPDLSRLARTIGDPTRMGMLALLMEGRALTAKELAYGCGVQPGTATEHLKRLQRDGLIESAAQGRHKYYRLASAEVAHAVEALMVVAKPMKVVSPCRRPAGALGAARFCYDHLAGELGTRMTAVLIERELLEADGEAMDVTTRGEAWLVDFGIDVTSLRRRRRRFAYSCLDWSERRDHLGGALGAALAERMLELGWICRQKHSRVVSISELGHRALAREFGLAIDSSESDQAVAISS
ncbi:MAG: winged helix-turn-helix domain-containing protein [Halomonas sp.]|uniref:Winged helix-turn-helix transcriptional regulator n=1 Tax=Halomonas sulfidivorans TaxID=2733488 RepID=A0ABX7WCR8_9GAMM|nr:winged helix-turn-helix domain-containing protein [Halomonas sulfidivorans]MDX5377444.1 winged helix-turn-helix domain-containing protein [Halomonas sp.]QTP57934.1 winged helix-turn-helix transcriptional regulator [Halomonas sulfidivorans]